MNDSPLRTSEQPKELGDSIDLNISGLSTSTNSLVNGLERFWPSTTLMKNGMSAIQVEVRRVFIY